MAADLALFPVSRSGRIRPCPRCQQKRRRVLFVAAIIAGLIAGIATAWASQPQSAGVHGVRLTAERQYTGARILDEAETKVNHWYSYGADGPQVFDCSGLVYWAAGVAGERGWPRDTFDIARLIGSRFSITSHPVRGDLAMWGPVSAPYHVEIVTAWNLTTFGTEQPTWEGRVTWHYDGWFRPSFYLRINW